MIIEGNPKSTEYESIVDGTLPRDGTSSTLCKALNCLFRLVTDLKLLFPTPGGDVPTNDQTVLRKNEYFFDFSFTRSANSAAISGCNFAFPAGSLLTQSDNPSRSNLNCKSGYLDCSASRSQCTCLHLITSIKVTKRYSLC